MKDVKLHVEEFLNFNKKPNLKNPSDIVKYMTTIGAKSIIVDEETNTCNFDFDKIEAINKKFNLDNNLSKFVLKNIQIKDILAIIYPLFRFKSNSGKNYIATKGLIDVLENVKLDIKTSYLPDNSCYIQFNEKLGYLYLCESTIDEEGENIKIVKVVKLSDENSYHMQLIFWDKDNLDSAFKREVKASKLGISKNSAAQWNSKDYELFKLMLNLVLYANSQEDLIAKYNEFSPKEKDKKYAEGYTKNGFYPLDLEHEYKILKNKFAHIVGVSGHFRWQPYGAGRSKIKLIFINPHEREYNKDIKD